MEIYDISQTLQEGMGVWPGDQKYRVRWTMRLESGDSCNVSALTMSAHTGTHLDAPYHFDKVGCDIAAVALSHYVGPARVVQLETGAAITELALEGLDWKGVTRVLFRTRASALPEGRFERNFAHISEDAAEFLGNLGLLLVGTDAPSVDAFDSKDMASHKVLLKHGVSILEGVRLGHVPPGDYELICLPLKLAGLDGSPVRAILRR